MNKNAQKNKILNLVFPLITIVFLVSAWAITAKIVNIEMIIPSVGETFSALWQLISTSQFYVAVGATTLRAIFAFLVSLVLALVLAILSSISHVVERLLSPIVVIARATPTMSIILLALIWLNSMQAPILVVFLIIFPMLYTAFLSAIQGVDKDLVAMSKVYNVGLKKMIFNLYAPEVTPQFLSAIQTSFSLSLKLTIASEVLAQTKDSIGMNMQLSKLYLDTPELIAWTLVAILLGAIFEIIVILAKKLWEKRI